MSIGSSESTAAYLVCGFELANLRNPVPPGAGDRAFFCTAFGWTPLSLVGFPNRARNSSMVRSFSTMIDSSSRTLRSKASSRALVIGAIGLAFVTAGCSAGAVAAGGVEARNDELVGVRLCVLTSGVCVETMGVCSRGDPPAAAAGMTAGAWGRGAESWPGKLLPPAGLGAVGTAVGCTCPAMPPRKGCDCAWWAWKVPWWAAAG
mmetsp:Transcript_97200/g.274771  ORF Transcript_97200/g.274771 Transcript_97200/m.274771 type:complete len:205 (+) Transcript_97200:345-959(+)